MIEFFGAPLRHAGALLLLLISFVACQAGKNTPKTGTETNWLKACSSADECSGALCLCGVCSLECVSDHDCTGFGANAHCAVAGTSASQALCTSGATLGLCLPACADSSQCGAGQQCLSGSCVAGDGVAAGGAGGVGSTTDAGLGADGDATGPLPPNPNCATAMPGMWTAMPLTGAPVPDTSAGGSDDFLWTGSELVVVDRLPVTSTSGRYDPCQNSWGALANTDVERYAPPIQVPGGLLYFESAPVSLGWASRLTLVDFSANQWLPLAADSEPPNQKRAVFWTGKKLIWWGGALQHPELTGPAHWEDRNDGGVYDLATRTWSKLSSVGAPSGRISQGNAVWTGSQLLVWGGWSAVDPTATTELDYCFNSGDYEQCHRLSDGGVYDLASDTWSAISASGAPSARTGAHLVWTGTDLLIIGGAGFTSPGVWTHFADAYRYNLRQDRWSPIVLPQALRDDILSPANGGTPDSFEWTGSYVLLKISVNQVNPSLTYSYDPANDLWQTVSDPPNGAICPPAQSQGVCSSSAGKRYYGLYRAAENTWTLLDYPVRDPTLLGTTTVWTGSQLLEWGGYRLGPAPDAGACPAGTACDPGGPPHILTSEGAVYTPQ